MLSDDVLIENNKFGFAIMQNNGAMKIVNFMHTQTAETRHSSANREYQVRGYGRLFTRFLRCVKTLHDLDHLDMLYRGTHIDCNL